MQVLSRLDSSVQRGGPHREWGISNNVANEGRKGIGVFFACLGEGCIAANLAFYVELALSVLLTQGNEQ